MVLNDELENVKGTSYGLFHSAIPELA